MPPGVFKLKVQNIYWKVKILEFKVGSLCWNLSRGVGVLVALESCCLAETKPGPYLVADLANVHSHASSPDPGPKTSAWFVDTRSTVLVFDPLSLISSTSLSHMLSLVWLDNNYLIFELPSNTIFLSSIKSRVPTKQAQPYPYYMWEHRDKYHTINKLLQLFTKLKKKEQIEMFYMLLLSTNTLKGNLNLIGSYYTLKGR